MEGIQSKSRSTTPGGLLAAAHFELTPPAELSHWKFVMVIPEGFPLNAGIACRVPNCRKYNVGGSSHEHVATDWVVIADGDASLD